MDGPSLEAAAAWAYSSVVEHCVDIAGVASSILATPTIFSTIYKPNSPFGSFYVGCRGHKGRERPGANAQISGIISFVTVKAFPR